MKTIWPFLILFIFALPATAEIFKWTDSEGKVHFSESKPEDDAGVEQYDVIDEKYVPVVPAYVPPKIDLYVTSWCPYCKQAMDFLHERNLLFNVYDIEHDFNAAARKKQLDPEDSGVPLAIINGVTLHGFDAEQYQDALNQPPPAPEVNTGVAVPPTEEPPALE